MPTGYTADIISDEGISFEKFVLHCARAFGALLDMRDKPHDAPIPDEFLTSDYHLKGLNIAQKKLEEFQKLVKDDYGKKAKEEFDRESEYYEKNYIKKNEFTRRRYLDMLDKVRKWVVPSDDHKGLKDFMIRQIQDSLEFDICNPEKPIEKTGEEWAKKELYNILQDIKYHAEGYQEEIEKATANNRWIKQLKDSLKEE